MLKLVGTALIVFGCGGWGFWMAANYRKEERMLLQLEAFLLDMENELSYRHTQLPQLLRRECNTLGKELGKVVLELAEELEKLVLPDVQCCMESVLARYPLIPVSVKMVLSELGRSLGRYDLNGQLRELQAVRDNCGQACARYARERESRIRSYQTLGLCAGAALAILLL